MKYYIIVLTSFAIASASLTGCAQEKPKLKYIDAEVVQICIEGTYYVRTPDANCDKSPKQAGNNWAYIIDDPTFPPEIPGVGQQVKPRGRFVYDKPADKGPIVRVPAEGALFPARLVKVISY